MQLEQLLHRLPLFICLWNILAWMLAVFTLVKDTLTLVYPEPITQL